MAGTGRGGGGGRAGSGVDRWCLESAPLGAARIGAGGVQPAGRELLWLRRQ